MPTIVSNEKLNEIFSTSLETRSKKYADLVSNANAILYVMKEKGGWKTFSGPTIRERLLYAESGTFIRYSGFELLNPVASDIFADAEYVPKMGAVNVTISGEDLLKNAEPAQLLDLFDAKLTAAENELTDRFVEDLHDNGTKDGGRQIAGLQAAVPTVANTGIYGGIDRGTVPLWRTGSYTGTTEVGAALSATNIVGAYTSVLIKHSRGKQGPNVIAADQIHYRFFNDALNLIQRVTKDGELGRIGFPSLAFAGAGYNLDVVLEGGIGSAMPANTTYFLNLGSNGLCFRYHPDRNFSQFGGKLRPVNQDAIVQHIGFMGNLTMANPLFVAKLRTS